MGKNYKIQRNWIEEKTAVCTRQTKDLDGNRQTGEIESSNIKLKLISEKWISAHNLFRRLQII